MTASTSPDSSTAVVHALEVPEVLLSGAREVDGIGGDDRRRDREEPVGERVGEPRQLEPGLGHEVGGDDARAAAVADDRDPAVLRPVRREARQRAVDELLRRRHAQDPRRAAGGLDRGRVARERTGVRGGRARSRLAASGREQDDLLARPLRRLAGARERPAVAEVLAVDGDHPRVLVGREGLDELGGVDVGLVPERGEARDADAVLARRAG